MKVDTQLLIAGLLFGSERGKAEIMKFKLNGGRIFVCDKCEHMMVLSGDMIADAWSKAHFSGKGSIIHVNCECGHSVALDEAVPLESKVAAYRLKD